MSWSEELKEFELVAWAAPLGDAEAYGQSLEDLEVDSDDLDDAIKDLVNELGDLIGESEDSEIQENIDVEDEDENGSDVWQMIFYLGFIILLTFTM